MKKIKLFLLIFIIFNFFYINPSFSKNFVIKIKDDNGTCASAFLTNDKKIVTASHVLLNCKKQNCENLTILKDEKYFPITNLKIEKISYALDVAVLSFDTINEDETFEGYNTTNFSSENNNLKVIGFPNCQKQKTSKGNVFLDTTIQSFITSKTNYGNSGSIVIDKDSNFYGMAIKASDISSSIMSLIFGKKFNTTILKAQVINKILSLSQNEILEYELKILKEQYYKDVMNLYTKDRLNLTTHFLLMIDNLTSNLSLNDINGESYIRKILDTKNNAPFLLKNISYRRNLTTVEENAEILSLIYYIEKYGFMDKNLKKLDINNLTTSLESPYRSEKHKKDIKELLLYFEKNLKDNFLFSLIARTSWYILLATILITFNIFAFGYIFRATKESKFILRILKSLFYPLLFWLFSLIIFNYVEKKKKNK